MKKSIALMVSAALAALSFASCAQNAGEVSSEAQSEQTAVSSVEQTNTGGKDMRITIENEFDTNKYAKQMKNATKIVSESQYRFSANSVSDFYENATDIIECEVIDTHFVAAYGLPYTLAEVKVLTSVFGSLEAGDLINVVTFGGYVSEYENNYSEYPNESTKKAGEEKLSAKEVNRQKNHILCMRYSYDEDFIEKGEKYVFALLNINEMGLSYEFFNGAYEIMSEDMTTYKDIGNGRYARWPNAYLEKHGEETENSIECFTVDWLKTELEKAAEQSSGTSGK